MEGLKKMAESEAPVVEIVNVKKRFGDKVVLNGIDLDVMKGEVVAILGPSGSGKSTLLRCVNHLEEVTSGSIKVCGNYIGYERHGDTLKEIFGKRLARQRQKVGMVFQHFNLYPHKTALENVIEGPLHVLKTPREQAMTRGRELLRRSGSPSAWTRTRRNCPAARSSGSRSPARSRWTRKSSCSTNRLPRSIPNW